MSVLVSRLCFVAQMLGNGPVGVSRTAAQSEGCWTCGGRVPIHDALILLEGVVASASLPDGCNGVVL